MRHLSGLRKLEYHSRGEGLGRLGEPMEGVNTSIEAAGCEDVDCRRRKW
jgi:hypothetical protein